VKILFDHSVLVAGMVARHPRHEGCWLLLEKALGGEFEMLVAAPTLVETHAALTALRLSPRITPALATRLIKENVEPVARVLLLTAEDYRAAAQLAAELDVPAPAIHHAALIQCAERNHAGRLATLHPREYLRLWPSGEDALLSPA
jgi:predicted nucleic acid-binding protein